ncbi:hypothetical protein [Streptomyces sp. TLI_171]|uniref:hypothetical protein n=1 Tax=Streptomyces sp. TLI_171 TaxID=1938859 RepID=UPI00117F9EA2|nr:hypothetical protein [Streptomyces sp. TLI_171]
MPSRPAGPPGPPVAAGSTTGDGRSHAKLWGVVAAVVSAAAGVASAIAAFTGGGSSSPAAAPPASVTVTAAPPAAPAGTGATAGAGATGPAPSPAAGAAVRWSGKWVLSQQGIDLTKRPPERSTGNFFYRPSAGRTGENGLEIKGTVALWTASEAPTAEGCRELLRTQPHDRVTVVPGDLVCAVDDASPIALFKVNDTHYEQGSYGEVDTEVTIWELRMKG